MTLQTKASAAGTAEARSNVLIFPAGGPGARKVSPATLPFKHANSSGYLSRCLDLASATAEVADAQRQYDWEPSEDTYRELSEAREHLRCLLAPGGNDAA